MNQPDSPHATFTTTIVWLFFFVAMGIHLSFLISLLEEPWKWEHGKNLVGSKAHPAESPDEKGFLDKFFHDTDRVPRGLDFFSIYQAGYNFTKNSSVYFGIREHRNPDLLVVPYFSGFRYLPVYAYTYGALLTLLPPWTSYWTWISIVEILFWINLYLVMHHGASLRFRLIAAATWLAYSPYYVELHIGQQSMVTATLLNLMLFSHLKQHINRRDSFFIGSVLWKINTILLLPLFIKFKRYTSIVVLLLLVAGLSAPYFFSVPGSFSEFISYFTVKFIGSGPSSQGAWTLGASIWQKSGDSCPWVHAHPQLIRYLLNAWNVLILATALCAVFIPKSVSFIHSASIFICMYFLTYQLVWEHHYVMFLPVCSILILEDKSLKWLVPWIFIASPTPYIFFNDVSVAMPQVNWTMLQILVYHGLKPISVIAIFSLLILRLLRRGDQT